VKTLKVEDVLLLVSCRVFTGLGCTKYYLHFDQTDERELHSTIRVQAMRNGDVQINARGGLNCVADRVVQKYRQQIKLVQ